MKTHTTCIVTLSVSLALFVPVVARAGETPTLDVTMSYQSNGEYIPVVVVGCTYIKLEVERRVRGNKL